MESTSFTQFVDSVNDTKLHLRECLELIEHRFEVQGERITKLEASLQRLAGPGQNGGAPSTQDLAKDTKVILPGTTVDGDPKIRVLTDFYHWLIGRGRATMGNTGVYDYVVDYLTEKGKL